MTFASELVEKANLCSNYIHELERAMDLGVTYGEPIETFVRKKVDKIKETNIEIIKLSRILDATDDIFSE